MRERAITLLLALGACALFYAMFLQSASPLDAARDVVRPVSPERRGNGYFAATTWLARAGVRTRSLRTRYTELPGPTVGAAGGNLLIVTLPAVAPFRTQELPPLDRWIRRGNTLLVLAALDDKPDWAFASHALAIGDLNAITGLDFELTEELAAQRESPVDRAARRATAFAHPRPAFLVANGEHAFFDGVTRATAWSDYPPQSWQVSVPYDGFPLALARNPQTTDTVLWERPFGEGRIIVSAYASLFTNRALGLADNARLFANIVAATVRPGGVVLFDDFRQGLGAAYDPARFYRDRRVYLTAAVLFALWLAWVLGSTRLRAPPVRVVAPREADFVALAGGFLARVLSSDAAARRLFELFAARLRARLTLSAASGMPWEWLEHHPRIAPGQLSEFKRCYSDAFAQRRVPLVRLQNLLVALDRQIA
jgi:hypothetical protein